VSGWLLNLTRAGAVGTGLMAGLFLAFSTAVMPALERLPAHEGAAAMQHINRDIQNPWFVVAFLGSTIAAGAVAVSTVWTWDEGSPGLRLAGGALFVLGNFVVTVAYHIPRNDRLDRSAAYWSTFLDEWVPANHVRTVLAASGCILLVLSLTD
jgi:uncharacterized membrane protein